MMVLTALCQRPLQAALTAFGNSSNTSSYASLFFFLFKCHVGRVWARMAVNMMDIFVDRFGLGRLGSSFVSPVFFLHSSTLWFLNSWQHI